MKNKNSDLNRKWINQNLKYQVKENNGSKVNSSVLSITFSSNTFYTLKEVAEKLKVSTKYLYEQIYKGDLKGTKIGRIYRIEEKEIETWLTSQQRR